jgi:hypothetical protein
MANRRKIRLFARRLHERSRCASCALAGSTYWRVSVEVVADGRQTAIVLCDCCLG